MKGEENKEESKNAAPVESRPFDPEKDSKSWDTLDLGGMLMAHNKKNNIQGGAKKIIKIVQSE